MNWESFYQNYRKPDYIPGYQLLNKLGGGVFGFVYKARKQSIGKNYAIKFLKVDDENVKRAVMHELEAIKFFAQVDHPHLVSIEDKGEVDGVPYIIMGYAGEETLKKRLEDKAPSQSQALKLFKEILSGVAALHEKSIIHFDLKPGNVFLKGDFARVGDYGLSRLMSESRKTLSFGRGTPYYMAPELLKKKGDNRSDIYSLGVILYECLTGEVPFQGDSEWEVLKKHEEAEIQFPPSVSEGLRTIIRAMMAKLPEDRYQSVKDIDADIDDYLMGAPAGATGRNRASAEPDRGRARDRNPVTGMAREDWADVERALRDAGVPLRKAGSELKNAGVEVEKALREVGQISGTVARSVGDHLRNHMLVPFSRGLDAVREQLVSTIAGNDKASKRARAMERELEAQTGARQDPEQKGMIGLFFRTIFKTMQIAILGLLIPIRFLGTAVVGILEFVLKLPFRVIGFLTRVVLVFFGVSVVFFMILALVCFIWHVPRALFIGGF